MNTKTSGVMVKYAILLKAEYGLSFGIFNLIN